MEGTSTCRTHVHPSPAQTSHGKGNFTGGTEREKQKRSLHKRGADSPDLNTTPQTHTAKPQEHPELKQTLTSDPWAVMLLPCRQGETFPSSFFV